MEKYMEIFEKYNLTNSKNYKPITEEEIKYNIRIRMKNTDKKVWKKEKKKIVEKAIWSVCTVWTKPLVINDVEKFKKNYDGLVDFSSVPEELFGGIIFGYIFDPLEMKLHISYDDGLELADIQKKYPLEHKNIEKKVFEKTSEAEKISVLFEPEMKEEIFVQQLNDVLTSFFQQIKESETMIRMTEELNKYFSIMVEQEKVKMSL